MNTLTKTDISACRNNMPGICILHEYRDALTYCRLNVDCDVRQTIHFAFGNIIFDYSVQSFDLTHLNEYIEFN